jgi:hypothetical protein
MQIVRRQSRAPRRPLLLPGPMPGQAPSRSTKTRSGRTLPRATLSSRRQILDGNRKTEAVTRNGYFMAAGSEAIRTSGMRPFNYYPLEIWSSPVAKLGAMEKSKWRDRVPFPGVTLQQNKVRQHGPSGDA